MSAGFKQMKEHVKAVQNIKKITQSMKVVAVAKFAKHEKSLRLARPLGLGANYFYEFSNFKKELIPPHVTVFAISSDRGLCGSMNAKVCKEVKKIVNSLSQSRDIVCIGEKAKGILSFEEGRTISLVVNGVGHRAPTFLDASEIVYHAIKNDEYMQGIIFYPKFRNMVSFDVDQLTIYSLPILSSSKTILRYELESDFDLLSFLEFTQVALIYYALCETYLVELCARIMAMSAASKNAAGMSQKLKLEMNRKRQQTITNELIDIVSGAQVVSNK